MKRFFSSGFGESASLSFWMAALSGLGIVFLVVFQWLILQIIGPGSQTDAFFAAMMVPELFQAAVTGSLTHALVPLFSTAGKDRLSVCASTFLFGVGAVFCSMSLLLSLSAPFWLPLVFPGFDAQSLQLTALLVKILLLAMTLTALAAVLAAASNARNRFLMVEASSVTAAAAALPLLIWGLPRYGIVAAAWAMCLRAAVQFVFLLPVLDALHRPDWKDATVRDGVYRLFPLVFGSSFYKTEVLLDRLLASLAPAGQLSLFQFARQFLSAGNTVIGKAIVTPMVPLLADYAKNRSWGRFRRISVSRLWVSLGICALFFLPLALVGKPVLSALLTHGRFTGGDVWNLYFFLLLLGGLWFGGAAGQVLATSFYAKGDTRTPTRIGIFAYIAGIGIKIGGFLYGGVPGLALATSLYFLLSAAWLQWGLYRSFEKNPAKHEDGLEET